MYPSGFRLNENDTIATMWASSGDFKQTRNAYGFVVTHLLSAKSLYEIAQRPSNLHGAPDQC